ncbi:MAG: GNAT family N-acetyltransferase [Bacilli bacterium]|nr:GNAT family N-acetyltransferase [Bacilli bacterium]
MIRKAELKDCESLAKLKLRIWKQVYSDIYPKEKFENYDIERNKEKFQSIIERDDIELLVVEEEELLGYISFGTPIRPYKDYSSEIGLFYLEESIKGKGLGKVLFNKAMKHFREHNVEQFFISCNKYNLPARGFYEKMGGVLDQEDDDNNDKSLPQVKYIYKVKLNLEDLVEEKDNIDLDEYIRFRESVKEHMEHPEWLGDFTKEEIKELLDRNSHLWIYKDKNIPVCSMMLIPARQKDLEKFEIQKSANEVVDYGPMFVNYDYVGNSLQYQMLQKLDKISKEFGYRYAASTIHPENTYSIRNLEKDGFVCTNQKVLKRGPRNIYWKEL